MGWAAGKEGWAEREIGTDREEDSEMEQEGGREGGKEGVRE